MIYSTILDNLPSLFWLTLEIREERTRLTNSCALDGTCSGALTVACFSGLGSNAVVEPEIIIHKEFL